MKRKYVLSILLVVGGFIIGWVVFGIWAPPQLDVLSGQPVRQTDSGYKFINPLLDCQVGESAFTTLLPFQDKVSAYVDQLNDADPNTDFVAVYFRDLNDGPWFGINEDTPFVTASLLKVPVMMTYFVEAESDPTILNEKFVYNASTSVPTTQQDIPPAETLESGKSYTVDNLIYRMIAYSDNLSQYVLMEHIDIPTLTKVFNDFDLPLPNEAVAPDQMSVREYASFFRVLFNGSYLSRQYSEEALKILSESQFKDGLVAGVPANIPVAHKFGEREFVGQTEKQLHDCGIVYYPNHPYLLCVMSRGTDLSSLASTIAKVSAFVYNQLDSQLQANPSSSLPAASF
jgi:beta-lactamase class A